MAEDSLPQKRKPLVSIERQYETDVSTGETEVRVFLKMYLEARDSGLLAALGDRMWRTLSCVATHMDENGYCYPSQAAMARDLGVRRENVNLRMKELLAFRFDGRPVISVEKSRLQTPEGGRWANNRYTIHPISGFAIFDRKKPRVPETAGSEASVRKIAHRPVCENPNTGKSHTNKNQRLNQKVVNALPDNDQKILGKGSTPPRISDRALRATYQLADAQLAQVHYLVEKQAEVLGAVERNHGHYVKRAAEAVAHDRADLLDTKLSEFKQATSSGAVTSPPAYFNAMWIEALGKRQGDAGGRSVRPGAKPTHRNGFEPVRNILRASGSYGEERSDDEASLA